MEYERSEEEQKQVVRCSGDGEKGFCFSACLSATSPPDAPNLFSPYKVTSALLLWVEGGKE